MGKYRGTPDGPRRALGAPEPEPRARESRAARLSRILGPCAFCKHPFHEAKCSQCGCK